MVFGISSCNPEQAVYSKKGNVPSFRAFGDFGAVAKLRQSPQISAKSILGNADDYERDVVEELNLLNKRSIMHADKSDHARVGSGHGPPLR